MTTVVFCKGILAADSQAGSSDIVLPEAIEKVWRTPRGLAGFTGDGSFIDQARTWTLTGGRRPKSSDKFTVIEVSVRGAVTVHEGTATYVQATPLGFYAWGSGRAVALGALYAGADAKRAVEIAALVDPWTGGDVIALAIGEEKRDG